MKHANSETYTLPKTANIQFLNTFIPQIFKFIPSKAKAVKAIQLGEILVNGNTVSFDAKVKAGDVIQFQKKSIPQKSKSKIRVYEEKIEVVFEDEHLGILNKPGGIPVNGNQFKTLENTLPFNLKFSKEKDALEIMRPLHRLDEPTCGLVLSAKTERAQVIMGKQFEQKTIRKRYKAVVIGQLKNPKGVINSPIDGKPSQTEYEVVSVVRSGMYNYLSLVNLFPVTGRTHQLRIHMSELGHPIVGDKYYTENFPVLSEKGLLLCSDKVWFQHPISNENIEVEIDIPQKFKKLMERENERFFRN